MTRPLLIALMLPAAAWAQTAVPVPAPRAVPASAGIDAAGFATRQTERMMAADADGDGRVSAAEWAAAARGGGDGARRARRFSMMDGNGDGQIDRGEIAAMLATRFGRIDADGNGRIDPGERQAARPAGRRTKGRAAPGMTDEADD